MVDVDEEAENFELKYYTDTPIKCMHMLAEREKAEMLRDKIDDEDEEKCLPFNHHENYSHNLPDSATSKGNKDGRINSERSNMHLSSDYEQIQTPREFNKHRILDEKCIQTINERTVNPVFIGSHLVNKDSVERQIPEEREAQLEKQSMFKLPYIETRK